MAHFMDVHHGMHGITADQLHRAHQADLALEKDENVHFERAWADPTPARSTASPRARRPTRSSASTNARGTRRTRSTRSR